MPTLLEKAKFRVQQTLKEFGLYKGYSISAGSSPPLNMGHLLAISIPPEQGKFRLVAAFENKPPQISPPDGIFIIYKRGPAPIFAGWEKKLQNYLRNGNLIVLVDVDPHQLSEWKKVLSPESKLKTQEGNYGTVISLPKKKKEVKKEEIKDVKRYTKPD